MCYPLQICLSVCLSTKLLKVKMGSIETGNSRPPHTNKMGIHGWLSTLTTLSDVNVSFHRSSLWRILFSCDLDSGPTRHTHYGGRNLVRGARWDKAGPLNVDVQPNTPHRHLALKGRTCHPGCSASGLRILGCRPKRVLAMCRC